MFRGTTTMVDEQLQSKGFITVRKNVDTSSNILLMSRRVNLDSGVKEPRSNKKRTWRRWKDASNSRERNNLRFMKRVQLFAKKFGLSKEQADEFSFTG